MHAFSIGPRGRIYIGGFGIGAGIGIADLNRLSGLASVDSKPIDSRFDTVVLGTSVPFSSLLNQTRTSACLAHLEFRVSVFMIEAGEPDYYSLLHWRCEDDSWYRPKFKQMNVQARRESELTLRDLFACG